VTDARPRLGATPSHDGTSTGFLVWAPNAERVDVVLLDAPPLLQVGDALTIASSADAVIAVVRSDLAQQAAIGELAAILARVPAAKLGFVVCGVQGFDHQPYCGYGHGSYGGTRRQTESVIS